MAKIDLFKPVVLDASKKVHPPHGFWSWIVRTVSKLEVAMFLENPEDEITDKDMERVAEEMANVIAENMSYKQITKEAVKRVWARKAVVK